MPGTYSKLGYFALIKEAVAGTPLTPTTYIEMLNESISSSKPSVPSAPIYGNDSKHLHHNRGQAEGPSGDITFEVEPNTIGYILSMFDTPTSSVAADTSAYTHTFSFPTSVGADSYTIDIRLGGDNFVRRYWGCRGTGLSFSIVDNVWQCTLSIQGEGEFVATSIDTTVSSGTTIDLAQTSGLTASDTMNYSPQTANIESLAITSVDSETQLTTATVTITHTAAALATIKNATPSFTQKSKFTWIGNTTYKEGALIGSVANVSMEQFSLDIARDVEVIHGTHSVANQEIAYYPTEVLLKCYEASCTVQKFWEDEEQIEIYQKGKQYAIEVESTNNDLVGATTVKGSLKFQMPDVRIQDDIGYNLEQDNIVQEARTLQVYNDATAAYQLKVIVVNAIATY